MFYFKLYDSFAFRYYIRIMNICSKIIINIISFSFLLCISEPLIDYKQNKTYQIFKISSNDGLTAPIIDGVLDDDIWTNKNRVLIQSQRVVYESDKFFIALAFRLALWN